MADTQVGKLIQKRRKALGMTQEELARLSLVSSSTIARVEQGKTRLPREDELARIAKALGLEPAALLAGVEQVTSMGVGADVEGADLTRIRIMTDYLNQSAEADPRDIPIILTQIERLVATLDAHREYERRNRRPE